jgi:hypothetical protein
MGRLGLLLWKAQKADNICDCLSYCVQRAGAYLASPQNCQGGNFGVPLDVGQRFERCSVVSVLEERLKLGRGG